MKHSSKKCLAALAAFCLVTAAYASTGTLARYTKAIDVATINLTVVAPACEDAADKGESSAATVGNVETTKWTELFPAEAVTAAEAEAAEPETTPADQGEATEWAELSPAETVTADEAEATEPAAPPA